MLKIVLFLCLGTFAFAAHVPHVFREEYRVPDNRIIDGIQAKKDWIPWQVAINIRKGIKRYRCGGSVIHENFVLTAAHCVENKPDKVELWFGTERFEGTTEQERLAEELIIHENYKNGTLRNDIALLYFTEPLKIEKNVSIVALPEKGDVMKLDEYLLVSGYGNTNGTNPRDYLYYIYARVISKEECSKYFYMYDGQDCLQGDKFESGCNGDSGGPTVRWGEKVVQHGIISFGKFNDCMSGQPFGITNVEYFIDWINNHLANPPKITTY